MVDIGTSTTIIIIGSYMHSCLKKMISCPHVRLKEVILIVLLISGIVSCRLSVFSAEQEEELSVPTPSKPFLL